MKKLAIGLLIIFIGFSIWYHIPTRHQLEMNLSTFQGENKSATITLDVKKHKSFINPTKLSGKIIYEGKVYVSEKINNSNKWKYKIQQKLDGELAFQAFYDATVEEEGFSRFYGDQWIITKGTDDLKQLILHFRSNGQSEVYAGHASNEQEAVKVALQLIGNE